MRTQIRIVNYKTFSFIQIWNLRLAITLGATKIRGRSLLNFYHTIIRTLSLSIIVNNLLKLRPRNKTECIDRFTIVFSGYLVDSKGDILTIFSGFGKYIYVFFYLSVESDDSPSVRSLFTCNKIYLFIIIVIFAL